jgi:hypothetical protein
VKNELLFILASPVPPTAKIIEPDELLLITKSPIAEARAVAVELLAN